ncbi:MAG TPA: hypothetical protein VIM53_02410 [Candidatus Saccharimonadales bacterium]
MSRLPQVGGDEGVWAQILNDFLEVAHTADGSLASGTVGSSQLQAASVGDSQVSALSQSKITNLPSDLSAGVGKNAALITRAAGFIKMMMRSNATVTTASTITADHIYDDSYTGAVSGTFNLIGLSPASEQLCPIDVTTPVGDIPDSYFSTVTGSITNFGSLTNGPYTVQAYKTTDADYSQPSSATVDGSGNFSLDLSTTPNWVKGTWKFGLLDSSSNVVGQKWPQSTSYQNIIVQHNVVTDTSYPVASQPAATTGSFSFLSSQGGMKQFQLVDSSSGKVLAEHVPPIQNVRSYLVMNGEPGYGTNFVNYCYSYDQAIALLAMLALGDLDTAQQLAIGLLKLQTSGGQSDGAFVFSAPQLSAAYGNGYYRTGAHAFATYALLCYVEARPTDGTQDYTSAIQKALAYLDRQLSNSGTTSGLYLGGTGLYNDPSGQPETFNEGYDIAWASAEHNFDVWHAYNKAASVLNDTASGTKATTLQQNILSKLWDSTHNRFYQGMQPSGPDPSDPLDTHTWGGIWLHNVGRDDLAKQVLSTTALAPFKLTNGGATGYAAAYDNGGYPGIVPAVWSEGTFGAAMAFLAIGDTVNWQATIDGIAGGQRPDGSFRYVTATDTNYEFTSSEATIGAAWAVLAALGHGIWNVSVPRNS